MLITLFGKIPPMKKICFYLIFLLGIFSTNFSILRADTQDYVGISEKELLSKKGEPISKASLGKKSIYRWLDMQVTIIDGVVDSVKLRNISAEEKREAERRDAAAAKKAEEERKRLAELQLLQTEAERVQIEKDRAAEERKKKSEELRQQMERQERKYRGSMRSIGGG